MVGLAEATGLDSAGNPAIETPGGDEIVRLRDWDASRPSVAVDPREVELPHYRGRLDALSSDDLEGTGGKLLHYQPRLFRREAERIAVWDVSTYFQIQSDLFTVFQFHAAGEVLQSGESILLANGKPAGSVLPAVKSAAESGAEKILTDLAAHARSFEDRHKREIDSIVSSVASCEEEARGAVTRELWSVAADLRILKKYTASDQRALGTTRDGLSRCVDEIKVASAEAPPKDWGHTVGKIAALAYLM